MRKHSRKFSLNSARFQIGQAMVEYAILIILLVTLVVGGSELAKTALASSKNTDAAKAGANELLLAYEVVKQNYYDPQKEYLSKLAALGITEIKETTSPQCASSPPLLNNYDNYVEFLKSNESVADLQNCLNTSTAFSAFNTDSTPGVSQDEVNAAPDSELKFKAIIILREIALLNRARPYLADHEDPAISMASCGAGNSYDYGLPNRYPVNTGSQVYLFHPLPINLASCAGVDTSRGNRSKLSILVGGYGKPADTDYVQGMPALNQAMYGLYTKVCLGAGGEYVSCNKAYAQMLLKPPGKLCLSTSVSGSVDSCPQGNPTLNTSGYYFWGKTNQSTEKFTFTNADPFEFRPTFQILCDGDVISSNIMSDSCYTDNTRTEISDDILTVQVHTRYRSVFEGFLAFGLQELKNPNTDIAAYFFDPSNLRGLGAGKVGVAIPGSELGVKSKNGNPTLKPFRDFRGCYEVNIESAQISACN